MLLELIDMHIFVVLNSWANYSNFHVYVPDYDRPQYFKQRFLTIEKRQLNLKYVQLVKKEMAVM